MARTSNGLDFDLAKSVAKYFRVSPAAVDKIVDDVTSVVAQWRGVAKKYHLLQAEQDLMARAFEHLNLLSPTTGHQLRF